MHAVALLVLAATFSPLAPNQTTAFGELSPPLLGDLRQAARNWALLQRDALHLPATSSLSPADALGTRFGASFHLIQQVDGVDVYAAKVVVTIDASRRVWQVSSSLEPYQRAVIDWKMSPEAALRIAAAAVPFALLQ